MKLPTVRYLGQLTWLDLGLFIALIATAVLWAMSRSGTGGLAAVDAAAWGTARAGVVAAFTAGDLEAARTALVNAAAVAEPADDGATEELTALAAALQGVDITALDTALATLEQLPQSPLFGDLYVELWVALVLPPFPPGAPALGAEWVHANVFVADNPTRQYWGAAVWTLPADRPDSAGEAAVAIPELGFDGKLMLAVDGEAMRLSLVFTGLFDDAPVVGAIGFSVTSRGEETLLAGTIATEAAGTVIMELAPEARAENIRLLQQAEEIGVAIGVEGERRLFLRIEVGDSGRAAFAAAFPTTPAVP